MRIDTGIHQTAQDQDPLARLASSLDKARNTAAKAARTTQTNAPAQPQAQAQAAQTGVIEDAEQAREAMAAAVGQLGDQSAFSQHALDPERVARLLEM